MLMDNQAKDLCRSKDSLNTNKPTCTFQQYACQDLLTKRSTHFGVLRKRTALHRKTHQYSFLDKFAKKIPWFRYFCVLYEGRMYLFKDETSKAASSVIHLRLCQSVAETEEMKRKDVPWPMKLIDREGAKERYFSAMSLDDLKVWIASIASEIEKAEQIYQMHDELKIQESHSRKSNSDDDGDLDDYEDPDEPQAPPESDGSDESPDYDAIDDVRLQMNLVDSDYEECTPELPLPAVKASTPTVKVKLLPPFPDSGKFARQQSAPNPKTIPDDEVAYEIGTVDEEETHYLEPNENPERNNSSMVNRPVFKPPNSPATIKSKPPSASNKDKPKVLPKKLSISKSLSESTESTPVKKSLPPVPVNTRKLSLAKLSVVERATWIGSYEECQKVLGTMNKEGVFLIRRAQDDSGRVLQVFVGGQMRKFKIEVDKDGRHTMAGVTFDNMSVIVDHFRINPLPCKTASSTSVLTDPFRDFINADQQ